MRTQTRNRLVVAAVGAAATGAAHLRFVNPRIKRWGATDAELARQWPGDDFVDRRAKSHSTRAITIDAPADAVWPWLAQIGQERGGFYSYTVLENLVGAGMRNADDVVAGWQGREVGDIVWLGRPDRFGGKAYQRVASVEPGRSLALTGERSWQELQHGGRARECWTFTLEPVDERTARLVVHSLGRHVDPLFDLIHFVMERKMMLGIKARAEAAATAARTAPGSHPIDKEPVDRVPAATA